MLSKPGTAGSHEVVAMCLIPLFSGLLSILWFQNSLWHLVLETKVVSIYCYDFSIKPEFF